MPERDEDSIDLRIVKNIIVKRKKVLLIIMGACVLLAIVIAFSLPKEYESTTLIRAKNQSQGGSLRAALSLMGENPLSSPTQIYIEMLKSRSVLEPVIAQLDLPAESKELMTHKGFAKGYLDIKNAKGTDLIEITATGKSPEEAQQISSQVTASFQKTLNRINQTDQSLLMDFLTERLKITEKEMLDAELALEQFRQDVKVYVPQEQSRAALDTLYQIDQQIINLEIQNQTNNIRLQTVNQQLEEQNVALRKYNLADNSTVQQMRERIINKQMALVEMTQRYTDKHPDVLLIKQEIEELEDHLKREIEQSIAAGTNTLNPIHASLLQSKAGIEASIMTGGAMEEVLRQKQAILEGKLTELSANSMTYVGLERQVRITQETYSMLRRSYEQTRIQKTIENLDFQIVDEAELAKGPSGPNKRLFVAVGALLGMVISFGYLILLYHKQDNRSLKY